MSAVFESLSCIIYNELLNLFKCVRHLVSTKTQIRAQTKRDIRRKLLDISSCINLDIGHFRWFLIDYNLAQSRLVTTN